MRFLYRSFLNGLITVLPLAVTVYLMVWLAAGLEHLFGAALRRIFPEGWYAPGLGLAAGLAVVLVFGVLLRVWLLRWLWSWLEKAFEKTPLIKTVYSAVKDMLGFFSNSGQTRGDQVVMVRVGGTAMRVLGFVTREDFEGLPEKLGGEGDIAVYLPMSYQIGGFTVMIPRSEVEPVDMSVEEALRYVITGGATTEHGRSSMNP